ncbi:hypothetical protein [Nostoc sp.]|uniref:hypothetical protein n=1 Tax=Nostoc sp. TaxID=1180 RepID=UPI002FFB335D
MRSKPDSKNITTAPQINPARLIKDLHNGQLTPGAIPLEFRKSRGQTPGQPQSQPCNLDP